MCFDEIFFHLLENDDQSPVGADSAQDSRMPAGAVQNPNRTEPPQSSMDAKKLPIYHQKNKLIQAVRENSFLIVSGETGSGKTTQLPQYLYEAGFCKDGKIGITQPRRVAAITVAQRVAQEMHCSLGLEVGYQVRFDDFTTPSTVVKYMTDGCLLREVLADPALSAYGVIILDEVHERSLNTDILLGLLKKVFSNPHTASKGRSFPLKVVVMSATMETDKLSVFLNNCPVFTIPGRVYPVTCKFGQAVGPKDLESTAYVKEVVKVALNVHTTEMAGDILVFLTGQVEIERACDLLFEKAECIDYRYDVYDRTVEGLLILPLYGSMPTDQQKQIFQPPPPGIRKCVVATNIAATSLTIDGIKYIVDSGFVKQLNHNSRVGLDVLEVVPISKSEARQRAGRAGRTSAGKCFRIYTTEFWEKCMPEYTVPEIQRSSLTAVILTLKCLGIHDVIRFPYLACPEERFILEALKQLYQFDAIDRRGKVTKLGELMVEFPLHPGLTRALLKAASLGCQDLLLPVAAMLSVENIFIRPGQPEKQKEADQKHKALVAKTGSMNDFALLLTVFQSCKSSDRPSAWCKDNWIHWRALKSAFSVETQLREILLRLQQRRDFPVETFDGNKSELFRQCLCTGYFTNVARRSVGKVFCTMDGHGSMVHIHPSSSLFEQETELNWVIFHDVMVTSRVYIRTVCPIRYDWVKDLLPKLHEVDVYELSSVAREEVTDDEMKKWETKEAAKRQQGSKVMKKLEKRNNEATVSDARARYLERKKQRQQSKAL
uniref:RNA helicase n=1 Tax=Oryzias melastigma TaxID=30732 RepID=A0A3B3BJ91_ORYME